MKKSQLAVQLYTLRNYLKTAGAVDRAFAKIREIGYEAVQVSGVAAPMTAVKKAADANGLTICATHANSANLLNNRKAVIDEMALLDCKYTAYGCADEWRLNDKASAVEFALELEKAAVDLAANGIDLSYHNHNLEFVKFDGEFGLDLFFQNAPHLHAEIDTYWVAMAGCDPAEWTKKYAGREPLYHLKDFGVVPFSSTTAAVGSGNLNWAKIIPEAEKAGAKWFIVEQDTCPKDPFECLADSYRYLMANFVK